LPLATLVASSFTIFLVNTISPILTAPSTELIAIVCSPFDNVSCKLCCTNSVQLVLPITGTFIAFVPSTFTVMFFALYFTSPAAKPIFTLYVPSSALTLYSNEDPDTRFPT